MLGIHTVFESHESQSPEKLKKYLGQKKWPFPVGVDKQEKDKEFPTTMLRYWTEGTPCVAVIDRKGLLRFKKFGQGIDDKKIEPLIEALIQEE